MYKPKKLSQPLDLNLTSQGAVALREGTRFYIRELKNGSEGIAEKLGDAEVKARWGGRMQFLEDGLLARLNEQEAEIDRQSLIEITVLYAEEVICLQEGISIYVRNMKSAQGTAKGLGDSTVVERWKLAVEHLEQGLAAQLGEPGTGQMSLHPPKELVDGESLAASAQKELDVKPLDETDAGEPVPKRPRVYHRPAQPRKAGSE